MIFTNLIQTNLKTSFIGRSIEYFTFTDSTNDDAWELILNNEADNGTLVITDYQKKGRGRRNNTWISTPGNNLTFSLIIREPKRENPGLFSILSGVAIIKGIKKFTEIECTLKWPNDVMLNNKKIGGILIETKKTDNDTFLVVGIGININEQIMPKELENTASSLRIEESNAIQREPLLAFILNEFEKLYNSDASVLITEWKKYCNHMNKKIRFHEGPNQIEGYFKDIDNNGNAIINIDSEDTLISTGVLEIS